MKSSGNEKLSRLLEAVKKYRYVIIILLFGVFLLLLPTESGREKKKQSNEPSAPPETEPEAFSRAAFEKELEEILSLMDGVGEVRVMLSVEDDGERVVASDSQTSVKEGSSERTEETVQTTVTVSTGSGTEDGLTLRRRSPAFRGAVVAAEGADSAEVRLELTEAVAAATGLPFGAIKIVRMG